jgi:hypothetical protein
MVTWSNGQVSGCLVSRQLDCHEVRQSNGQSVKSKVTWWSSSQAIGWSVGQMVS